MLIEPSVFAFYHNFQRIRNMWRLIQFPASYSWRYVCNVSMEWEQTFQDNIHSSTSHSSKQMLHRRRRQRWREKKMATQSNRKYTKVKSHWRTFTIQQDNAPFKKRTQFMAATIGGTQIKDNYHLFVRSRVDCQSKSNLEWLWLAWQNGSFIFVK